MSAFAALALTNEAATSVTFSPMSIDTSTGIATYATSDGIFDAKSVVSISTRVPSAKSTRARLKLKVSIPIMDPVVTSKKADECLVSVEFSLPRNATSAMRLDTRAYAKALIAHATSTAFLTSFEGIY
jgi:hypothetical protein